MLAGVFTNSVFGLIRAGILLAAVHAAGGNLGGYTALQAATYVWFGQALLAPMEAFGSAWLSDRVKSGEVAIDLLRPMNLLVWGFGARLGRSGFTLLARGIPPMLIGLLVTGLSLPPSIWSYLLGGLSIGLGITVSYLWDVVLNLMAFSLVEIRGLQTLSMTVVNFFGGFMVPLSWLPPALFTVAYWSPFPAIFQTPLDVVCGRATGHHALALVGLQLLWIPVLALAGAALYRRGVRRLEVQGG